MNKKQEQLFVLIQDLCLAFIINSAATILMGGIANVGGVGYFLLGCLIPFTINYIAGLIIPVSLVGNAVANFFRCKQGSFIHYVVRIFIINAIYVTIISITISLLNNGCTIDAITKWWETYYILHIVGFIASLLLERGCIKLAKIIIKDDEF